ncbi:MAG TPA: hypothetical protein VFH06_05745 [Candidatus Saccharimonadales bacterium]|nr:hypothetical protein [Candidatus Saccharimonadales bacterium]
MAELEIIENKFTLPLECARPSFDVRKGWNETIARKLGEVTRMREHPRLSRAEAAAKWQEWHNETPRSVYTLGRRASLLALASFSESVLATDQAVASHKLDFIQYADPGRDYLTAFLLAAHQDLRSFSGATWVELDPDGDTSTHLYSSVGYTRISEPQEQPILVRQMDTD